MLASRIARAIAVAAASLRIRRRLSVAAATIAVAGGSMLTASPAYADYVTQNCNVYHSWTECISYDYTNGNLAVNALNGYSTTQVEALWMSLNGSQVDNRGFSIPPHTWAGYAHDYGSQNPFTACAGINNVQIICASF